MGLLNCRKRASILDALFCFLAGTVLLTSQPVSATDAACQTDRLDETVQVKHVHDGDTVWLADGRKLRVIGINTPELARDEQPAEALAEQARNALQGLLGKSARLGLRHGREKSDRYGRLLAHLFLPDGRNVSEWLLRQGLAFSLTVPPNLWQADCYQRAEQQARRQQKGLWDQKQHRILLADALPDNTRGFHIVRGRVQRISNSRHAVWLNFNQKFALRIVRDDLIYFGTINFEKLKGKQLEVRGWVQYHKQQLRMRIRHPASMRILP